MPNQSPIAVPAIRNIAQVAQYGFTMVISFDTAIQTFINGREQRWKRRAPLFSFTLPIGHMLAADKTLYNTFFDLASGRWANNISLNLNGTIYSDLSLDADEIGYTLSSGIEYNTQITLRQNKNSGYAKPVGSPLAGFPLFTSQLGNSYAATMPFTQRRRWYNQFVSQSSGPSYVWKWYGGNLTGFPATPLYAWDHSFSNISDANMQVLIDAAVGWDGEVEQFVFNDPTDHSSYQHCRLSLDKGNFVVQRNSFNSNSCKFSVVQTAG